MKWLRKTSLNFGYTFDIILYYFTDVNECTETLSIINGGEFTVTTLSQCSDMCTNTIGSFKCDCRIGFVLSSDNKTCIGKQIELFVSFHFKEDGECEYKIF